MAEEIEGIQGIGKSGAFAGTSAITPSFQGSLAQASAGAQGLAEAGDASSLSPAALEALQAEEKKSLEEAEKIQQEQEELKKKILELINKLNEQLAKGDIQGADQTMKEIQALIGSVEQPPSINVPEGGDAGNIPGVYGDAPAYYPKFGGVPGGPRESGGAGTVDPGEIENIRKTLPGEANQGIVNTALDIASKGYPYVWGGDGPQEGGYDCSGFTHAVYAKNGINIPRTAQTQYDYCKKQGTLFTDMSSAKAGDLIFFNNPYPKKSTPVGHVMIYLGNGKMVGAQSDGVKVYDIKSMQKYIVGYGRPH